MSQGPAILRLVAGIAQHDSLLARTIFLLVAVAIVERILFTFFVFYFLASFSFFVDLLYLIAASAHQQRLGPTQWVPYAI